MHGYVGPRRFAGHCTYSLSDEAVTTALNRMTAGRHLQPNQRKQSTNHRLSETTREAVKSHVWKFWVSV